MNQQEMANAVYDLSNTGSRNEKKQIIRDEFGDSEYALALLAGQRFDDIGVGKKTFEKAVKEALPNADAELENHATYVEALRSGSNDLRPVQSLYQDCLTLSDKSGHDQRDFLVEMLENHNPPMVAFAVLRSKRGVFSTGATENTIAQAFCEPRDIDYNRALGLCPDVAELVQEVQNGKKEFKPEVGKELKPMLAKSSSASKKGEKVAQMKLDGYRGVWHCDNKNGFLKVGVHTRRLNWVEDSLPELRSVDVPMGEYIFDMEILAEDGSYKSTSERVGADNFDKEPEMEFHIFDIIVDDGEDVSREPYHKRYERLSNIMEEVDDDNVHLVENYNNIAEAKQKAEDEGYEGVIIKDLESEYKFNKRSSAWVKSKNTHESVDVVVSGFVEGEGRNDGRLGKVLVETKHGTPVGGVGTGFTDAEREEIWNNQDEWRGSIIEVTAEAYDESLRFPAFERRRDDDDGEADTEDRLNEVLPDDA